MNRIISLSVEDMYIKYTGEAFGATGSHNAVTLRMTFGPAWEGTAKTAYFTDALGNTSVALVLGLDTLVDGAYEVDVPSEALKYAGEATVTIKGVLTSGDTTTKAITTAAGHFRVLDSELPESAGNAGTITPSDKEQLQAEIAGMETLFTTAKAAAEAAAANAKVSETNAKTSETAAASSASSAEASKTAAADSAATATAKASAAGENAAKAAASQISAKSSEDAAKVSETAAKAAQTGAETAESSAQNSAAAAASSAQTAQGVASTATGAASTASTAAEAASGAASQASAAATAAAGSAAGAEAASKTAKSWAVGGTNTRPGEDTDNAKYWAKQAEAVVGGNFATKVEAQGYVTAHNQSNSAHSDIRNALNGKEASGTAAAAVTAHNKDSAAHADIREALAGKEAAGAAAAVQSNLTAHAGNTTVHVTSEEKTAWNGKAAGKHATQHWANGSDPIAPANIGALPGVKVYGKADANGKIMAYTDAACTQEATIAVASGLNDYGNALLIYDHKTYQCVGFSEEPNMAGAYIVAHFARSEIVTVDGAAVLNTEHAVLDIMGYLAGTVDAPITITTKSITPAGIGAAPAGFGLGQGWLDTPENFDANTITKTGWYRAALGTPSNAAGYWWIIYAIVNVAVMYQFAYAVEEASGVLMGTVAQRSKKSAADDWTPWEYINPPTNLGVEYRTTERYLGKPVYTKLVGCGALPNATRKTINHGIANVQYMLRYAATCVTGDYLDSLPSWYSDTDYCTVYASTTQIVLRTPNDLSNRTANAQLWYTKTTD